ncbi:SRA stem-loop-interacting RNA-binding protein, mitochondrial [Kryptolebias marmoratus]|uniref:SRA stem-loop interacting RNA binding protein n=1 Tax=Kryptolebias marmoratus TaxID=37003 RepID=A0A3Q2ZGA2_KRYMA|nr:SRA stem-loop-interacting RNA-binding protein, mitochondrial [Kryptolebias marmoratus]
MAASSRKVFEVLVSKVPWTVANKEIKDYFRQFGQIKRCFLPFDKGTGFHKGYCWIRYSNEEGLNNALEKDPHVLEGTKLQVQRNTRMFVRSKFNKDGDSDGDFD